MTLVHLLRAGTVLVPPFPEDKLPALLHAGTVLPTDWFWHAGMAAWQPVSTRWVAAPPSAAQPAPAAPPVSGSASGAASAAATVAGAKRSRWDRPSRLLVSETRYRETCAPWSGEAA